MAAQPYPNLLLERRQAVVTQVGHHSSNQTRIPLNETGNNASKPSLVSEPGSFPTPGLGHSLPIAQEGELHG